MRRKLYESRLANSDDRSFTVCAREHADWSEGMTGVTSADIFA